MLKVPSQIHHLLHRFQWLWHRFYDLVCWLFTQRWVHLWMRLGHGAKGLLYGLIGWLAISSIRHPEQVSAGGSERVLTMLSGGLGGPLVLAFLATGLAGYSLWRFIQAIVDPDHTGEMSLRQGVQRLGYAASGLTYLSIANAAGQLAVELPVDFDDTLEDGASFLIDHAFGPWLLLLLGAGVVVVGLTYVYGAVSGSYINEFRPELYRAMRRLVIAIGKVGVTARGAGFILIGLYVMQAAFFVNASSAGNLGSVLEQLRQQPLGDVWLGGIAFGFLAYAVYMIIAAYYRRFPSLDTENYRSKK